MNILFSECSCRECCYSGFDVMITLVDHFLYENKHKRERYDIRKHRNVNLSSFSIRVILQEFKEENFMNEGKWK